MDEAIRELIHRTIDHEADPAEEARLQAILGTDPAARAEWEETNALNRMFAQAGLVEPPPESKAELLGQLRQQALQAQSGVVHAPGRSRFEHAIGALRRRFSVRSAFVFAAGAAAGIAVFAGLSLGPQSLEEGSVPGSIVPSARMPHERGPFAGRAVGEFRADLDGGSVVVRSRTRGTRSQVEIDADSPGPVGLVLEFDSHALRLRGIEQDVPEGAGIVVDPGQVRIEQHGRNRYWLWLEPGVPGSVEIRIRVRSSEGIQEGSLQALPTASGS